MPPELSIIIINWNTCGLLMECLRSIYESKTRFGFEVIVVDNASTDDSVRMVSETFPQVKLLQNARNLGFAAANNRGISIATGAYLLLLNSDTRVLDSALEDSVNYMREHPSVGVLGCRVLYPDLSFQSSYFRFQSLSELVWFHWFGFSTLASLIQSIGFSRFNYPSRYWGRQFTRETRVDAVAGCFLMTRRHLIEQVGTLDEDFFFYGEEEEWCFRFNRAGWATVYYPHAAIIHVHGASSKRLSSPTLEARRARLLVFQKTRGPGMAWLANVVMWVGAALRSPLWIVNSLTGLGNSRGEPGKRADHWSILRFHSRGLITRVWAVDRRGRLET